jgi:hypothetical protein
MSDHARRSERAMDAARRALALLLLLLLLPACAVTDGGLHDLIVPPKTPKVLIIGIDGWRADVMPVADTPHLDALIADGCFTDQALTGDITVSGPGWSSFLCGVWRDKHGSVDNEFQGTRYDRYPHMFQRLAEAAPDVVTAHLVDWKPIDEHILGDAPVDYRFFHDYTDHGDVRVIEATLDLLVRPEVDLLFLYLAELDNAGHAHGYHPTSPGYVEQLETIDGQVGRVMQALRARPDADTEDWLVIVSTDHSGTLDGSHGRDIPAHRRIPFVVSGPSAARGRLHASVNQVDIPATAFAHLGVPVEPAWEWDGRPVGLAAPRVPRGRNLLYNGGAEQSTGRDTAEVNAGLAGWSDTGAMTAIRYGAPEGHPGARTPGPPSRGHAFFCGGAAQQSEVSQLLDVATLARDIDGGTVRFELSGWLGGFADQRDQASVSAEFLDEDGVAIGRGVIGPVTVQERREAFGGEPEAWTGLLRREASGPVPPGTRRIRVLLSAVSGAGSNDGYADELALILR